MQCEFGSKVFLLNKQPHPLVYPLFGNKDNFPSEFIHLFGLQIGPLTPSFQSGHCLHILNFSSEFILKLQLVLTYSVRF